MPQKIRFASFNVENLFSRARVLNHRSNAAVAGQLAKIEELNKRIHQTTPFTPADKRRILELYDELKEVIDIRENRGDKLFNRAKTKVVAASGADWDGELMFEREEFTKVTRENTAQVIKSLKADVACLVEVEDRQALAEFNSQLLDSRKFKYPFCIDGNDPRGIDVALLSNFPLVSIKTHIFDGPGNSRTFSRDCLRTELQLPDGRSLHVLCNHFKSKSGGESESDARRERQAKRVAEILQEYNLSKDLVIVAGDLNDTPDPDSPLRPLLDVPRLSDVLALAHPTDATARWTYHFRKPEQIDFVLVSEPLKVALKDAGVERRGIHDLARLTGGKETQFKDVTSWSNAASDHGAVWAEFEI